MPISTINQNGLNAPLTLTSPVLNSPAITGTPTGTLVSANMPTGSVLQVVQGTATSGVNNSTSTFIDTGLTVTITPKFATSKILITVNNSGCGKQTNNTGLNYILLRNGTMIQRIADAAFYNGSTSPSRFNMISAQYLDLPATTSALTYKTQFASYGNVAFVSVGDYGDFLCTSTITVQEIAG